MFRIKSATRILRKPQQYFFTSAKTQKKNYPYVFGGINIKEGELPLSLTKGTWPQGIKNQFREAYITYLQALRDKDKQFLKQILEQSLLENIEFEDVKLINEDAHIEVQIIKQSIIIGVGFDRRSHNDEWEASKLRQQGYLNVYFSMNLRFTCPVLFSVQVCFKSKRKLVKNVSSNEKINDQDLQTHTLQMEVQNQKCKVLSIFSFFNKDLIRSFFDKNRDYQFEAFKSIINSKQAEWKIADVDRILGENFPQLSKNLPNK